MTKYIFKPKDFKVFQIEGLDARMAGLEKQIRPQLNALGDYFADYLETVTGETFYAHVAKHARRKVNPLKTHGWHLLQINAVIKCCLISKSAYLKTICL